MKPRTMLAIVEAVMGSCVLFAAGYAVGAAWGTSWMVAWSMAALLWQVILGFRGAVDAALSGGGR